MLGFDRNSVFNCEPVCERIGTNFVNGSDERRCHPPPTIEVREISRRQLFVNRFCERKLDLTRLKNIYMINFSSLESRS